MGKLAQIVWVFAILVLASTPALAAADDAVEIKDAALRGCIETALDTSAGETITEGDLAGLSELRCEAKSVADLAGLEQATGLTTLRLGSNDITDLTPLAGLVSLQALYIDWNPVEQDLSPLANLLNLKELGLHGITTHCDHPIGCSFGPLDYSALGRLTKLERLDISRGLRQGLLAEVSSLTALKELYVNNAFIWDISPLVENQGLDSAQVEMYGNPLSCAAISEDIPALRARGANVVLDSVPAAVPQSPKKLKVVRGEYKARLSWKLHRNEVVNVFEVRYAKENEDNFGDWLYTGGGDRPSTSHVFGTDGPPYGDAEGLDPDARYLFEARGVNTAGCGVIGRISAEPHMADPKADAGKDQTVPEDGKAQLDGSGSSGPSNHTLTYSWRQSAGSPSVTIEGADTATPSFATPNLVAPTTLTFELTVTAGEASATDTVDVTIDADNDPPTARAGRDQTVAEVGAGKLDGGASSDPEGEPLAYSWRQSAGKPTLTLTDANTATPSFATPNLVAPTTLTFELTATAGGASTTDTVKVTIDADNDSPTANAGEDQTVAAGGAARLDGSASSDPEGEPLDYSWRQSAGEPSVALAEGRTATPSFKAPSVTTNTTLTFELTVTAGGASTTDTVDVTIEAAATPVAHAGKDRTVAEDGEARLDGSGSSGPAGKTLAYSWRQTSGEPSVSLSGADTATPSFATPNLVAPTTLTFELTVSVAEAKSTDTVDVTIDADNDSPTANAGEDQTVDAGGAGRLDGGASSDPEGESLDYSWRQSAGEPSVALAEAYTATPSFKAPSVTTNATLTFELTVTAGGASATDAVDVTIDAGTPTVSIADARLRQCIEKALGKEAGESPTEDEMATLTTLRCGAARDSRGQVVQVASLAGLEHASNLASLEINGHAVSDLSPLAGLTSLRRLMASSGAIADVSPLANLTRLMELRIAANRISDVTPLAGLTALRTLDVGKNAIADISALASLTSLTYLGIYYNGIADISAIKGMTGLQMLSMYRNAVADIGVVSGLTSLVDLNAENNDIWDISPLTANTGLGSAASLYLAKNPLGCAAVSAVAKLEAKGVSVGVDAADAAPGAPANLAAEMASGTATLTWDAPQAGTVRVHEVRRAGADGVFGNWEMVSGGAESRSHRVQGLADGSHAFEVRAVNSAGCGEAARISTESAASPTVTIADSRLRQCVEEALDKTPGEPTTEAEMATLTKLVCGDVRNEAREIVAQVASLAGLEHATSLVRLQITDHAVSDLSPLSGLASLRGLYAGIGDIADVSPLANLTGLTELNLPANSISDVTPLAGLTSLRHLDVGQNAVSDISSLAGLTSLTFLGIYSSPISDISVIAGMTRLERLYMSDNMVADIGALSGLTSLVELSAERNDIWDISALTANAGIGSATIVALSQNPLGCAAVSAVAELEARGVRIHVSPADAPPSAPANLAVEVDDGTATLTWDAPQAGTVRVHEVRRRSGANGFGSWEMVPGGGESRSHRVSDIADGNHVFEVRAVNAAGCSAAANASIGGATVSIGDAALRRCIERKLHKASGSAITEDDMASIERLNCRLRGSSAIRSLEGLRFATSLRSLNIRDNAVSDLSPIAQLPLATLDIDRNAVSDLSPIAQLPLATLDISHNAVTDFSALTSLRSLTTLRAGGNATSDLAPLGGLTGLTTLSVIGSDLVDISPLAGLTNLTTLWLGGNAISDVSALATLTSLEQLDFSGNAISDVSALAELGSLTYLGLGGNAIADVSPLRDLIWLHDLRLSDNRIADVDALVQNLGFGRGDYIGLNANPIPCGTNALQVQTLRARGVVVFADDVHLSAPLDLVGAPGNESATLSWRAPEGCAVARYEYRQGTGKSSVFHAWQAIGAGTSHTVSGLANGLLHAFEVRAVGTTEGSRGHASGVRVALAADPDARVEIHDPRLSEALADMLSDAADGEQAQNADDGRERTITQTELATLTTLSLDDLGIAKLNGLEHAVNLRALRLRGNAISTLAPIGDLPLLSALWLSENNLQDISALRGLVELTELALDGNQISDIAALSDLPSLMRLWLNDNAITDIGPLVANSGLGSGDVRPDGSSDYVDLRDNPLGTAALDVQAPALRERGAAVLVDDGSRAVHVFLASGSAFGESFLRIHSQTGKAGEVSIVAIDASGRRYGPTRFALGAGQTKRIDSDDLEHGNSALGIAGVGAGEGDWRLEVRSKLSDLGVSAYTRTKTGLVASMTVAAPEAYARHRALMFDPAAREGMERSGRLRVINPTPKLARALIEGVDDGGRAATVEIAVPAGATRDFTAAALAAGKGDGIVSGALGSATGRWRLRVTSYDGVRVLSLMSSAAQLTNLSLMPPMPSASDSPQHLLMPAAERAERAEREGFLRFVNYSPAAASVEIRAFDRDGGARGAVSLTIDAGGSVEITPLDLAQGSAAKGLPKGVGEGVWRLELRSSSEVYAGSYMGVGNGAPLVAMHGIAPRLAGGASDVVFFNPASSHLASRLRLVNVGTAPARVTITGVDDDGSSPGGAVQATVPAGATREFRASELEKGDATGLSGALGDGRGKWRLRVESDGDIFVVSLVESQTGYVENVSR